MKSRVFSGDTHHLVINGDGRKVPLNDNFVDAVITDHPYYQECNYGGNRNFASYACFRYTLNDFKEKARILKNGNFLVEFLPEENASNWRYLAEIKNLAEEAGFTYYAKVPWIKADFVANTGRKSKNSEDILFLAKGKARSLRYNAKNGSKMSGTNKMLPSSFIYAKVPQAQTIAQSQKPIELLEDIISFITLKGELILDQFAGSGVTGIAAAYSGRNSVLFEQEGKIYKRILKRFENQENLK